MGISIQIYFIDEKDRVKRLPRTKFERLLRGDPKERFPRFAGKQIRSAEAAVYFKQRRPVQIAQIIYFIMYFDANGHLDQLELNNQRSLSVESLPPIETEMESHMMINARHRFAQKRYEDRYRWTPTPKIEEAVINTIFSGSIF